MASETPMQPAQDSAVAAVVTPPERADEIFLEGHARDSQSSARCCESCAISFAISRSSFHWSLRDRLRFGANQTILSALRTGPENGRGDYPALIHVYDRRRTRGVCSRHYR